MELLVGLIGVIIALASAYGVFRNGNYWWIMQRLPTTPIGELTGGLREIKGEVSALSGSIQSPRSHVPCVYYRFHVEEEQGSGKHRHWVTMLDLTESAHCLISDDTGACEIDLELAEMHLDVDRHETAGMFNSADPDLIAMLDEYGISTEGYVFNKTMRFQETVLEEGDAVYIIGDVMMRPDAFPLIMSSSTWFFISDRSETYMKSKYLMYAAACMAGLVFGLAWTGFFCTM